MSETETKPDSKDPAASEHEASSHPAAELEDIEEFDGLNAEIKRSPKLKELLQSPDSPSRYLTILSIVFSFLGVFCLALLVVEYMRYRHSVQKPVVVKASAPVEVTITEPLGEFKVSWPQAELRVDIVAECSSRETCDQIKERISEVRDAALPVLQNSSRENILNPDKKLALRRTIAEKINDLKLGGKVTEIDFSDMTVEVSH